MNERLWRTCPRCLEPVPREEMRPTVFHYGPDFEPVTEPACAPCHAVMVAARPFDYRPANAIQGASV